MLRSVEIEHYMLDNPVTVSPDADLFEAVQLIVDNKISGICVVTSDREQYENLFGVDPQRDTRWRLSPNLTWYPSEFSKIRLQYNYDDRKNIGVDHSIWLQFEFLLGSHGSHKF